MTITKCEDCVHNIGSKCDKEYWYSIKDFKPREYTDKKITKLPVDYYLDIWDNCKYYKRRSLK